LLLYWRQHQHLGVAFDIALEKSIFNAILDTSVGFLVYQEDIVTNVSCAIITWLIFHLLLLIFTLLMFTQIFLTTFMLLLLPFFFFLL
jgi:hypothetical protein